jgi:threonine dehydrogenase-like Zn-dependent dehydrogenase
MGKRYGFNGNTIPYKNKMDVDSWGAFYIHNEKRIRRPKPLHPGPCPLCVLVDDPDDNRDINIVKHKGEEFWVIENTNPIVRNHLLIFPHESSRPSLNHPHRIDLNEADVEITIQLACIGFSGMVPETTGKHPALIRKTSRGRMKKPFGSAWAVYVNTFPGTGRSEPHLHVNCVPADLIPLLSPDLAPWQVCRDKETGVVISRMSGIPFYSLAFEGENPEAVARTVVKMHYHMNAWEIPYNILAFPKQSKCNGLQDIRIAIVPRDEEYSEAGDQKLGGLEFLSGALIPGAKRLNSMNSIQRDQAFLQATLKNEQCLKLERLLRGVFGMPRIGMAVYPVHDNELKSTQIYKPEVKPNKVFEDGKALKRHWISPSPEEKSSFDALWEEANVLVRVTHASICQSDRRVLLGTKKSDLEKEPYVLGHEAGGYVVDPGPWSDKLTAGEKVVVLPHLTCGSCEPCRSHKQNLCKNMRHLGFDLHGSMVELMSFPYQCILPVGGEFPDDALTLVEPLACILRALFHVKDALAELSRGVKSSEGGVNPFIIYGAGPIGCLTARAVMRFWPNVPIKMVEPRDERRRLVRQSGIAETVVNRLKDTEKNHIGFVASSMFRASLDAMEVARHGGTVVLFSGINKTDVKNDDGKGPLSAEAVEEIHRYEHIRKQIDESGKTYTLFGSSGYNFDDAARSVRELRNHYAHYRKVQNVVVSGLNATEVYYDAPLNQHRRFNTVLQVLLSPFGIDDPQYGSELAETLKVLIKV